MTEKFGIDEFLEFENKNKLFSRKFHDIHYWAYLRFGLYYEICQKKYSVPPPQSALYNYTRFEKIQVLFKNILWSLTLNPFLNKRKSGLLILNQQRRIKVNNEYLDPQFDTWIKEEKKLSHTILEDSYFGKHFPVSDKKGIYYLDFFILLRKVFRFLKRIDVSDLTSEITELIEKEFNEKIDKKQLTFKLRSLFIEQRFLKRLYRKLLINYKPKALLINCYYNFTKMIFIELAHNLKIPVIEFQHGTMGRDHLGYNFPEGVEVNTFPDYVFVWGKFWKEVTRFPVEKEKIIVTGYPFFEKRIIDTKHDTNRDNLRKSVILFISQNTIGKELSKIAVELFMKTEDKYKIIYKLHPGEYYQWEKKYPWLKKSGIEVVASTDKDIYQYFADADIQIGVYSTALFEGLGYGLLTIVVQLPFSNLMEDLYKHDYVEKANNSNEIIDILSKDIHSRDLKVNDFWAKDSINNIIQNLYFIINNQNI